ncbi:MAG: hypothetical protein E6R03_04505 [Hyphomicrobiaceae bacterium]|nr:MAG: hypothetical protein E6R03_04505 [Hyphomicrobiaceae bacterium]
MTNYTQYQGAGVANTDRTPSPSIWADFPSGDIRVGIKDGWEIWDDFVPGGRVAAGAEANYGDYLGFASTGGSVTDGDEVGGVAALSSDGDDEGASLRSAMLPFQISRTSGKLWFECRVKTSTITDTKHGIFVGLMGNSTLTATSPITAAGALADVNLVGFHRLEGDGDMFDCVYKADLVTQVTVLADAVTLVADTYVKLGMVFDPRTYVLTFYRNGVKIATYTIPTAQGTDFPNDVRLGLVMAVLNATASTPGSAKIDWWRAGQLAA